MISVRRIKLEVWIRQRVRQARQTFRFLQHPERFLTTTLVGNNIAVVAASSVMAVYLEQYISGILITIISSTILLFFGETLPKSIARDRATTFTIRASLFLRIFHVVFYPLIWSVMRLSQLLLKIVGLEGGSVRHFFSRRDLALLVREGEQAGLLDKEERGLISRFILRGQQKVREVMIPRTDMTVVKVNRAVKEASKIFEKTGYSRLPVIGKTIDEVLGVINARDILLERPVRIKQILRDVLFVPETQNIAQLLGEMQKKGMGIAVVVDEYGGTAGLITLEDIMEEFFGEILDEFDVESRLYKKIAPKQIDVNARVEIEELNRRFDLDLPVGDYQTLGGLLMEQLGSIPKRGEKVELDKCTLIVLSAYRKKVSWVRVIKKGDNKRSR